MLASVRACACSALEKRMLITDIIAHATSDKPSMIEVAYELLQVCLHVDICMIACLYLYVSTYLLVVQSTSAGLHFASVAAATRKTISLLKRLNYRRTCVLLSWYVAFGDSHALQRTAAGWPL